MKWNEETSAYFPYTVAGHKFNKLYLHSIIYYRIRHLLKHVILFVLIKCQRSQYFTYRIFIIHFNDDDYRYIALVDKNE